MWVCGGKEVEADVGREDFLRQRRLKEGREALLEDVQSYIEV